MIFGVIVSISSIGAFCAAFYYLTGGFKHITEIIKNIFDLSEDRPIKIEIDEAEVIDSEEIDRRSDYEKYMAEAFIRIKLADGADGKIWKQG